MRQRVYVETTIISYLTARPSRDLVTAGRQQVTRQWWEKHRDQFELFVSEAVLQEIRAGDAQSASARMNLILGLPSLRSIDKAADLAAMLVSRGVLPLRAAEDAAHLALAAHHGMEFLLTWNCRHLANAQILRCAYDLIRSEGYKPPIVCTPDELMGTEAENEGSDPH